ncbi:Serine/threonine protein kinase [Burkholderia sp. 8Y]|uniref:serine/threonine-protein kinase n=1 Tax=Burkholderia sp. 8Y TaxID=2653133 RepID=UPI0012F04033|nr:serine/threonine-protein kinase [Burkholderia sp. 8Y]VXB13767.1 Serine/threonine protein kinase [Burkholderia sp. 8Y]
MSAQTEPPVASLGKYRVGETLGAGAMGIVYRAFDPDIERHVAIKTVRRELLDNGERASLIARFRNEAQAAGRLAHPHIVGVYDYGETADTAYIVMELVSGRSLKSVLEGGRIPDLAAALDWFAQLLAALGFAHERGVIHRDVKPANLLIDQQGRLKVTDFGIAHVESSALTMVGAMIGTPGYMSPEQFSGDAIDARSDLFSAAVVLYQMLTGQRAFAGASQAAVMQQVMHETPPLPSACNPALPPALDAVLMRALSKARAARYASASALSEALFEAAGAAARRDDDCTVLEARAAPCTRPSPDGSLSSLSSLSLPSSQTQWPDSTLGQIEACLAAQIGPVARLLVRRCAQRATDLAALVALVAPSIPSEKARAQFIAAFRSDVSLAASVSGSGHGQTTSLPAEDVQAAARKLAVYVGPIALIIAKREAARAHDIGALHARLAASISNPRDRELFARDVGLS